MSIHERTIPEASGFVGPLDLEPELFVKSDRPCIVREDGHFYPCDIQPVVRSIDDRI